MIIILIGATILAVGSIGWWVVGSMSESSSSSCPGDSSDNDAKVEYIERTGSLYDEINSLSYKELKRLHFADGRWVGEQSSGKAWSEKAARAVADSMAKRVEPHYNDSIGAHCKEGRWHSGWSEKRAFDEAIEWGKKEVAGLEDRTA